MELCGRCTKLFESSEYENAVSFGEKNIREYPNSAFLKLRMGYVFMMHTPCARTEDEATHLLGRAEALTREAAESENIKIHETALSGLSALLMQQKRYEEALKALDGIHSSEIDPNQMKVSIYYAMGDYEKSKQVAQYLLATHAFGCNIALGTLSKIAKKKRDYPLALRMENLSLQLSKMFGRDQIYGQDLNHYLMIAQCHAEQKQERETLDALGAFLKCAQMPADHDAVKASPFFDSIEMSETAQSKSYLNHCVREMINGNPAFHFLSGNREYQDILAALGQLPE